MTKSKHNTVQPPRRIRSFVKREGRFTDAQQRALEQHWPLYGLDFGNHYDFAEQFGRTAPLTLEIGFGNGMSLASMAQSDPETDFLGIEVHRPGVGRLLHELATQQIHNVRVWCFDAVEILNTQIPDHSLDRVLLLFPDPWPKRKHHKRRLVQDEFVNLIATKLKANGLFHLATDWQPYAQHMLETLQNCEHYSNLSTTDDYVERPDYRPHTHFESRGKRLGHNVYDLIFRRR